MNATEQNVTLKSVVARLLRDVADLQQRVEALEAKRENELVGSIDGLDGTLTVTVPPQWEVDFDEPSRTA